MTRLSDLNNLISNIPEHKIERLAHYVSNADTTSVTAEDLEDDLGFTPSEARKTIRVLHSTKDGRLLATTLTIMQQATAERKANAMRLVMTGRFYGANADYTHETIYRMIGQAKSSIVIVGYWMYEMRDLIERISQLQESRSLRVKFIMNAADKWQKEIFKAWNKSHTPEIFGPSKNVKSLHAKIVIIDKSEILITSANLTINAMEKNIEAGIWTSNRTIIDTCHDVLLELENNGSIVPIRSKFSI